MARALCDMSFETGRQIGVLIERSGQVVYVIVGDPKKIVIPALSGLRSAEGRLKGVRCIHTHLGGEDITDDDLMDLVFLRLDLMAIIKMRKDGLPEKLYAAHLVPAPVKGKNWAFLPPEVPTRQMLSFPELITSLEEEFARTRPVKTIDRNRDRAILISVTTAFKQKEGGCNRIHGRAGGACPL